jgi:hypothetical protein
MFGKLPNSETAEHRLVQFLDIAVARPRKRQRKREQKADQGSPAKRKRKTASWLAKAKDATQDEYSSNRHMA